MSGDTVREALEAVLDRVVVIDAGGFPRCVLCGRTNFKGHTVEEAAHTSTCPVGAAQAVLGARTADAALCRLDLAARPRDVGIKNEHIVWAYADRTDGAGKVVVIGLTEQGLKYLRDTPGQTLLVNPPANGFAHVTQIAVFHEQDKATLKERFRQTGQLVSEVN